MPTKTSADTLAGCIAQRAVSFPHAVLGSCGTFCDVKHELRVGFSTVNSHSQILESFNYPQDRETSCLGLPKIVQFTPVVLILLRVL